MDIQATIFIQSRKTQPAFLPMQGRDGQGNLYGVDGLSLLKNGRRILPIMGEFHYSRYESDAWKEELLKMKAGGIQIVSTYVFWIHHEEKKGEWDFSGCRNLRLFLKTCQGLHLMVWLRLGPWAHGECRNGGFPDYVAHMDPSIVRTNDPEYLEAVETYFQKLGEQCRGLMLQNGGPVIGIQLENEYGHCGGSVDEEKGKAHMLMLKSLAIKAGFVVPYYTATGWGSIVPQDEFLSVQGGYVDAPWATTTREIPLSVNFLFSPNKVDENIGSDHKDSMDMISYDVAKYPWLTAELGAGIQPTSHRRPVPSAEDILSQALCFLGSGMNLPGYYMYHGGINPDGKYSTLQETQAVDIYNDLPVKSYDFQTCIRESGEINNSFGKLKRLHLLIQDYESLIAGSIAFFPEKKPSSAQDLESIRFAVRYNEEEQSGFLFLNNHQRKRRMKEHEDFAVEIVKEKESLYIDHLVLKQDESAILPFGLKIGNAILASTNASLLCRLGETAVFYSNLENPYFEWKNKEGSILLLSSEQADRAFKIGDSLYICEDDTSCLIEEDGKKVLLTKKEQETITIYRESGKKEERTVCVNQTAEGRAEILFCAPKRAIDGSVAFCDYGITLDVSNEDKETLHQLYLSVDYAGDRAEVYIDGKLVDDWFTTGEPWHIALRRFGYPKQISIRVYPSDKPIPGFYGKEVYYDLPVEEGCEIRELEVLVEYSVTLD